MPAVVIQQFEKEYDIQVNYTEYDSNETLYAKLKSNPKLGYDLIFPSTYYVSRMAKENMLLPLSKDKLSNMHNLNPALLGQDYDPENKYCVPYLWGTAGIVVNKRFINPQHITAWRDFWRPEFKNQLLMFDDMREVFAIALLRMGYSINETNEAHIAQAYRLLKNLWPNIKLFSVEAEQNIYIDEDAYIGMGYNGEIFNASFENPNLVYLYPKEGFELWVDCMAIPIHAPHVEAALAFINFLLRPEIAKQIAVSTGFSTPNKAATPLLPDVMRKSSVVNPDTRILKKGQVITDLGEINAVYEAYWNRLKIGE
jgi:spermidine/putrescine transport system substrate-binding protein